MKHISSDIGSRRLSRENRIV
ncbi:hypothetical protein [Acaryochloris marina]|nr:hypothetical protein [Acaryochloris marina]